MTKAFGGWTNGDGTRKHDAPEWWPWGTIGPVADYGSRFIPPDEVLYEKPSKERRGRNKKMDDLMVKTAGRVVGTLGRIEEPVEATAMPGTTEDVVDTGSHSAFDYMSTLLSTTPMKVKSK